MRITGNLNCAIGSVAKFKLNQSKNFKNVIDQSYLTNFDLILVDLEFAISKEKKIIQLKFRKKNRVIFKYNLNDTIYISCTLLGLLVVLKINGFTHIDAKVAL